MSGPPSGVPAISAELWDSLIPIDAGEADADPTPSVVTTVPTTTVTPTSTPAAASYQHFQSYSHYQQPAASSYQHQQQPTYQASSYQQYVPPATSQNMARQAITNSQNANAGAFDTADVATLNDAIGSAGVDLRAEEESLQRSHQQPQSYSGVFEDRSRKQPPKPHFDAGFLGSTMRAIAARHKLASATPVPDDCVTYLALALRARLQDLVSSMIAAARHRQNAQFDRPVSVYDDGSAAWGVLVRSDVAKQLEALARVERAEEVRAREGREKLERALEKALEAVLNGDVDVEVPNLGEDAMDVDVDRARPKKKAKQAVSEEAGRRMTNAAANRAAGGAPRYAWLAVGTGNGAQRKSKIVADGDAIFGGGGGDAGGGGIDAGADAGATPPPPRPRPYKPSNAITAAPPPLPPDADQRMRVTLRDAMFVIEKERGHGGGRGAARGWT